MACKRHFQDSIYLLRLSEKSKWPTLIILTPLKINNLQATENRKMSRIEGFLQSRYLYSISSSMQGVLPSIYRRVQSQWRSRFRFGNDSESDLSVSLGGALIHIHVQKMKPASYVRTCLISKNSFESKGN